MGVPISGRAVVLNADHSLGSQLTLAQKVPLQANIGLRHHRGVGVSPLQRLAGLGCPLSGLISSPAVPCYSPHSESSMVQQLQLLLTRTVRGSSRHKKGRQFPGDFCRFQTTLPPISSDFPISSLGSKYSSCSHAMVHFGKQRGSISITMLIASMSHPKSRLASPKPRFFDFLIFLWTPDNPFPRKKLWLKIIYIHIFSHS